MRTPHATKKGEPEMKTVSVEGLPEPIAQAVQVMVRMLRETVARPRPVQPPVDLPVWEGTVLTPLNRHEIYGDVG
jgi:hypothetical protein